MAILKHIASKNASYRDAFNYLVFQHNEFTQKPILNENGKPILREEYYIDGILCKPEGFANACSKTNKRFNKNQKKNEIKSHHYILSFDPRDKEENGLSAEEAQRMGMNFAAQNFPGHQALICTHTDGHNGSGNIHAQKVKITNLQQMAHTYAFVKSHGYASIEELEIALNDAKTRASTAKNLLKATERRLAEVNKQIRLTGQYLANKAIYTEYRQSKKSEEFYEKHRAEITLYETARDTLREMSGGQKLPSMKSLKEEKEKLVTAKNAEYEAYQNARTEQRDLQTVYSNVRKMLGLDDERTAKREQKQEIT